MILLQKVKREVVRAVQKLDSENIGYRKVAHGAETAKPSLSVHLGDDYRVEITLADLSHLVRAADRHAVNIPGITDWRNLG